MPIVGVSVIFEAVNRSMTSRYDRERPLIFGE
jgi:hypothetical protein